MAALLLFGPPVAQQAVEGSTDEGGSLATVRGRVMRVLRSDAGLGRELTGAALGAVGGVGVETQPKVTLDRLFACIRRHEAKKEEDDMNGHEGGLIVAAVLASPTSTVARTRKIFSRVKRDWRA